MNKISFNVITLLIALTMSNYCYSWSYYNYYQYDDKQYSDQSNEQYGDQSDSPFFHYLHALEFVELRDYLLGELSDERSRNYWKNYMDKELKGLENNIGIIKVKALIDSHIKEGNYKKLMDLGWELGIKDAYFGFEYYVGLIKKINEGNVTKIIEKLQKGSIEQQKIL